MNMIIKFSIWELLQKENISVELMTSKFQKINQSVDALVKYQNDRETASNILNSLICSGAIKKLILQAVIEKVELGSVVYNLVISNLGLSVNKSRPMKVSYVWQNNPDKELPELYNLMVDNYKLIASETTFEQFKAVFTGQKIDDKFVPIKWHDDTASEVGYFLMRLIETNNIIISSRNKFIILNHCFIKNNGSQFDVHWKQINQNLIINLSKEKQKRIDDLISDF